MSTSDHQESAVKVTKKIHLEVNFMKQTSFKGRSVEDGLPVTKPLYDLEDLLAWEPNDPNDPGQCFSISSVPYRGKNIPKGSPKTLVCHDMDGGYLGDRFVQGKLCNDEQWYYLAYWDIVDTFVYFSHHFVTIPPVGWINCAHRNGVAVLGTVITEHDIGYKRCNAIFSHKSVWKLFADQLVSVAKYYKFEGWLLNIENNIPKKNTTHLKAFVKYLTEEMHSAVSKSQVIWYDSVTSEGDLMWQNQLNSKNQIYFDSCDGIFLNYTWNKSGLKKSAERAMVSERVQDVYVGVDVFGRNCYGGGGMNTCVALDVIRRYSLSAAIFAPGWVKEVLGSEHFETNQHKFWTKLSPYCNRHTILIGDTFFATDYNVGIIDGDGKTRFLHLSQQSLMPCLSNGAFNPVSCGTISPVKCSEKTLFKTLALKNTTQESEFLTYHDNRSLQVELVYCDSQIGVDEVRFSCLFDKGTMYPLREFILTSEPINHIASREPMSLHDDYSVKDDLVVWNRQEINIEVSDATWKMPTDSTQLLLSCSLRFFNVDPCLAVQISYKCFSQPYNLSPKMVWHKLGVSYCSTYRVNEIPVPSPIYHGPEAVFILKVQQLDPLYPIRKRNSSGMLTVTYGENMPEPPL